MYKKIMLIVFSCLSLQLMGSEEKDNGLEFMKKYPLLSEIDELSICNQERLKVVQTIQSTILSLKQSSLFLQRSHDREQIRRKRRFKRFLNSNEKGLQRMIHGLSKGYEISDNDWEHFNESAKQVFNHCNIRFRYISLVDIFRDPFSKRIANAMGISDQQIKKISEK